MTNASHTQMQRKIRQELSRRDFLRYSGVLIAASALKSRFLLPLFDTFSTSGPPLRSLAQRIVTPSGRLFKIGIYLELGDMNDPSGVPEQLAAQQFNHRVNKGTQIVQHYAPTQWSFESADNLLEKALRAQQSMIGELIWSWDGSIPTWIKNGGYNRNQLIGIVQAHISKMLTRYKGKIGAYQVVNEAHNPGPAPHDWWEAHIGSDYVQIAFRAARQADPTAVLLYNHYGNETIDGPNYEITKQDVDMLKSQGLVDAVGVQLHLWYSRPGKSDVITAMQSYGVPVWVTEFDTYQLPWVDDPPQEQATITQSMQEAALESGVCDCFTNWGLSDTYSCWGASHKPCLWDQNDNAKPSYYAMQQALKAKVSLRNHIFLPIIMR